MQHPTPLGDIKKAAIWHHWGNGCDRVAVICTKTHDLNPLREAPNRAEREDILSRYYRLLHKN